MCMHAVPSLGWTPQGWSSPTEKRDGYRGHRATAATDVGAGSAPRPGLMLYGPLWTAILRWERVATVVTGDAHTTVSLIPVRAPVLILPDGRRFTVRQAAAYHLGPRTVRHHSQIWVDEVAAELEVIRLAYRSQPQPSSYD